MKSAHRSLAGRIAVLFVITGAFLSCAKKTDAVPASEFVPYVTAHTGGTVYATSSIWIELATDHPEAQTGAQVADGTFSFSPAVKGAAVWDSPRKIRFVPAEGALRNGQTYEARFKLGLLADVPKRLETFRFTFRVEERQFSMRVDPLIVPKSAPGQVEVKGVLQFNSPLGEQDRTDHMLSAVMSDGQEVQAVLTRTADPALLAFTVNNIRKSDKGSMLTLTADGKPAGSSHTERMDIAIPALHTFEVTDIALMHTPEFGVQITCSEPVSPTQDLKGLVTLDPVHDYTVQAHDNTIRLYFDRGTLEQVTVTAHKGLRSAEHNRLADDCIRQLTVDALKPQVEMTGKGNILPNSEHLIVPFRAASLRAVDLRIIRIFENNVLTFLQTNDLTGKDELRRVGRLVYKKTLRLDNDPSKDLNRWNDYSIDLTPIMQSEPGAIYRIELSFRQAYSAYPCGNTDGTANETGNLVQLQPDGITEEEEAYWDNPEPYFYYYGNTERDWETYRWNERDNPCHASYYMEENRVAACNVMASDLGVIAKANAGNRLWVAVSRLTDTKPAANADIRVYNLQLQPIGSGKTDSEGFAVIDPAGRPFILTAEADGQRTYLRLVPGEDNSTSRFDTGGKTVERGLKGYIYGERGVWRPGDTLFVSFMLHDPERRIPANHPVVFELYNSRGQFYNKQIATDGVNGCYTFRQPTTSTDPTGVWNAYVKVGGATFHKPFRIETIKPNRLKINLDLPDMLSAASTGSNIPATLTASWLTGAAARRLAAKVEMELTRTDSRFAGYEAYQFTNPATDYAASRTEVFDGTLDDEGTASFRLRLPKAENAPGMLSAHITSRVFEQGGDASVYTQSIPFSPFNSYVGIRLNQPEGKYIETDTEHTFDIVTLDGNGRPVNRNNLEYKIYRLDWSWWWEHNGESFADYVNSSSYTPVASGKLKTTEGKARFSFRVDYPEWGRYLVHVKDRDSGHATGGVVYVDWPDWRGRSNRNDPNGIKMLSFTTDKASYEVGEEVTVMIPKAAGGRALITMENGTTVLQRTWVTVGDGEETKHTFRVTKEMSPNFYIHISLLQPHAQTVNDLPIRLYGIVPVMVTDKASVLEPQIDLPGVLRPEQEFTVKVSEKNRRPMTYTLAVVDEGLLDLTAFKTPDPWNWFHAREALGIRTWDMYDYVIGAFSGRYGSLFSTGGDEELRPASAKANRFKPVVRFIGPFSLDKGKTRSHRINLPLYVGSVRVMVVAGQDGAYGKADKTVPVRSPLMVLSSLPRVLSTNESVMLPVNVFVMEDGVKQVSVKVETEGLLQTAGKPQKTIAFKGTGDEVVYFPLKTGGKTGTERVKITATGGGRQFEETIEIDVRNPHPPVIRSAARLLESGETASFDYDSGNMPSAGDWAKLEVSRIPTVDISRRFDFLYNYRHCCSEQLASKAFPLLYVAQFKQVDREEDTKIKENVREAIRTLYSRQLGDGGFVYWPGQGEASDWITSYAGHFLLMAQEKGYEVNDGVLGRWQDYQRRQARNWTASDEDNAFAHDSQLGQAYRLYTLALAGAPEQGAMNRMKEQAKLSPQARWRLAAAYAVCGKMRVAEELVFNQPYTVQPYRGGYTYGSSLRDEAMILETLLLMGRTDEAFRQAQSVSQALAGEDAFSTQSTAYALIAMGGLAEKTSGRLEARWTLNDREQPAIRSAQAVVQQDLPATGKNSVTLTNEGKGLLYAQATSKSFPATDTLPARSNGVKLDVSYTDLNGNALSVKELRQGTDFYAVVKITNTSLSQDYKDMALTHIIPSGWEIFNERTAAADEYNDMRTDSYAYRDIRDDRVLTYFDLRRAQTKIFTLRLQSAYIGQFVLPAVQCEAMYEPAINARTQAGWVKVVVSE